MLVNTPEEMGVDTPTRILACLQQDTTSHHKCNLAQSAPADNQKENPENFLSEEDIFGTFRLGELCVSDFHKGM